MSNPPEGQGKKLVFIGDSGVGKTCIISRITKGTFEDNILSTVGASYASKTIEIPDLDKKLTFDIWDTAGQEKYKALTRIFFQGAKMAILVYDITRKESFENLKTCWYHDIKEHGDPDIIIGIAGNKCDLYEYEDVSEKEAREFAKSIDAVFYLTSAQSNTGITELFEDLGKKYLGQNSQTVQAGAKDQGKNPGKKQEPKQEQKQNIKIGKKDVIKKNEEQKKKKSSC